MSPYRVVVMNQGDKSNLMILSAMLSINKYQDKRIFIVQRMIPIGSDISHAREIAHSITTKGNSGILARYAIERNQFSRYTLYRHHSYLEYINHSYPEWDKIDDKLYLQSDCLKLAMEHYCQDQNYSILETL